VAYWPLAYDGSHHYADTDDFPNDQTATATFTFTGVGIYYMSPLWPYPVSTVLTLDSDAPTLVEMTDPENSAPVGAGPTVESAVLWGQGGLENTEHTLVMSMASNGMYVVVDALIYTVLDPSDTSTSTSSSSTSIESPISSTSTSPSSSTSTSPGPSPSAADTAASSHHSAETLTKTVIGAVFGVGALALLALAAFMFWRRRRQQRGTELSGVYMSPDPSAPLPGSGPTYPEPPMRQNAYNNQPVLQQIDDRALTDDYRQPSMQAGYEYGYAPKGAVFNGPYD